MEGWKRVGRCQVWLPNATSAVQIRRVVRRCAIPPPCLSNPHRGPPAHACALAACTAPCTCACTCDCTCTCTCTWVFPPSRPSRLPQGPTTSFPAAQREGLLHCLPVHSRLQHCIFPDPHLSAASASSSRNGNASARGRRNAFLLSVSALALALTLSLPLLLPSLSLCVSVCSLEHPAARCRTAELQSASALCHVMLCHPLCCVFGDD